jgi:hypothetical protein
VANQEALGRNHWARHTLEPPSTHGPALGAAAARLQSARVIWGVGAGIRIYG